MASGRSLDVVELDALGDLGRHELGGHSRVSIERSHAPGRAEGGEDRRSAGPHLRTSLA